MKLKYIKLFESEYWDKILRLRELGLADGSVEKIISWLDTKREDPTAQYDSLDLTGSTIRELPSEITKINSYCILSDSLIERLPARLEIGGSFWISDCPELTHLPEELIVGGNLSIVRCPKLTKLPAVLKVGADFNAMDAPIDTLPEQSEIKGKGSMLDTFVSRNDFMDWARASGMLDPFCVGSNGPREGVRPSKTG
jgi:hypothetical protein